ncbi:RNA polymerase III RPC4 [Euphorbia peplus]|nr:RNA polymerase III RPC4 [Euphorbia peplus]
MDSKPPLNPPRKLKFAPKAPPRRAPATIPLVKGEKVEDVDSVQAKNLLKEFQERSMRGKPKIEKKVQGVQSAFGFVSASTKLKSYGVSIGSNNQGSASKGGAFSSVLSDKEYAEPWDYYTYYPVTTPLRRPYAGNPAILDAEEFGNASEAVNSVESSINHAVDLSLMDESLDATMFFLRLPPALPNIKRSATADVHGVNEKSVTPKEHGVEKSEDYLPGGIMGKMLVYRSGAVKLKLGDTLFDVSPGMDRVFAEDVTYVNTAEKRYTIVSEINKRATITPDVDAIISNMADL